MAAAGLSCKKAFVALGGQFWPWLHKCRGFIHGEDSKWDCDHFASSLMHGQGQAHKSVQ